MTQSLQLHSPRRPQSIQNHCSMFTQQPTGPAHNPNRDAEVVSPPSDSISCLAWSPRADLLLAGSWDRTVRCYEIAPNGTSALRAQTNHDQPVLCVSWVDDGARVLTGGCDNKAKMWTLQSVQVGQHDAPIKFICWDNIHQAVLTGGWDKMIKYWDCRSANPVVTVPLPERVYSGDYLPNAGLLAVSVAPKQVIAYDIRVPTTPFRTVDSPLKMQTRCIGLFNFGNRPGIVIGSIEGRCGIHYFEDKDKDGIFTFKCHRDGNNTYAVNDVSFHNGWGTFATCGSDGAYNFWDKESRQRLKGFSRCNNSISCGKFNTSGTIYAYAVSYDWSKGVEQYKQTEPNYILLHNTNEAEIKSRPKPPANQQAGTTGRR